MMFLCPSCTRGDSDFVGPQMSCPGENDPEDHKGLNSSPSRSRLDEQPHNNSSYRYGISEFVSFPLRRSRSPFALSTDGPSLRDSAIQPIAPRLPARRESNKIARLPPARHRPVLNLILFSLSDLANHRFAISGFTHFTR